MTTGLFNRFAILTVAAVTAICGYSARGSVVISDPLTGSGNLIGTAPVVDTYNSSDLWARSGDTGTLFTRGTAGTSVNTSAQYTRLGFIPSAGEIYTLQATYTLGGPTTSNDWLELSFDNGAGSFPNAPWMLIRTGNSQSTMSGDISTFSGYVSNEHDYIGDNSGVIGSTETMQIVLDTRSENWVTTWEENGVALGSYTFAGTANINEVGFGSDTAATGVVSDFSLTSSVPEPTTLSLLSIGSLALLRRRRVGGKGRTIGVRTYPILN